ncbi:hypothetical protein [Thermus filiformis]|uniref:Cytochrome B561 n=1 Tax=Thermus filiformis TaxID=276 RepID=A0A0A2XBD5_THEFI|nr:hypothetical protein [Thermus filiformis]KGQ22489.1 hypothetical protein THFILI_07980 [Thermus filiformis]
MELYPLLLSLHNLVRWLVLLSGLLSLYALWRGLPTARVYASGFAHAFTFQLLLGLLLQWQSPLLAPAYQNLALARESRELSFFLMEHWVGMLLALGLAHAARAQVGKNPRRALGFTLAALALTLLSIPWWRPLLRV